MQKFKGVIALLLSLTLILSVATACSSGKKDESTGKEGSSEAQTSTQASQGTQQQESSQQETKQPEEQVTLKFVFPGETMKDQEEVFGKLNEKSLKEISTAYSIEYVPWSDYGSKRNLYMQSGQEFDGTLVFVTELAQMWAKGGFLPLNDYISPEKTPSLLKTIPEQIFKDMAISGKYTCIPSVVSAQNWYVSFIIRGDLREKYKMPKITTIEQLEEYFANIKKNDPDVIPISSFDNHIIYGRIFGNAAFVGSDYYFGGPAYVDPKNPDKVQNWIESEIFKKECQMHRKWYVNGWMNPDVLTAANPPDFSAGKLGCMSHDITQADGINNDPKKLPGIKAESVILYPEKPGWRNMWANNLVCVPLTSKHADRVIKWTDWLYADKANYDLLLYGIPDKHNVVEGDTVKNPPGYDPNNDGYPMWNQWYWAQGNLDYFTVGTTEETKLLVKKFRDINSPVEISPTLGLTMDVEPVKTQMTMIQQAYDKQGKAVFAGAVDFDSNYPKLVKAYKDAGVDKVLEEAQKQYDAWRKSR